MAKAQDLLVTEVFYSLQGEGNTVGIPTVFIRLTGCPRRCTYCDTAYAFYGGKRKGIDQLLHDVCSYGARYVTVTGGEPLAQPSCYPLLRSLNDTGYQVSLETSGTIPLGDIDARTVVVMDLKTPSSGEMMHNCYANIEHLSAKDQIKFVIGDMDDYRWACETIEDYALTEKVDTVLFSPSYGKLEEATLADWILRDKLSVRLQVQLHKLLWGDVPGR
jgi:7-carboxy-7-deazaguanine synthase